MRCQSWSEVHYQPPFTLSVSQLNLHRWLNSLLLLPFPASLSLYVGVTLLHLGVFAWLLWSQFLVQTSVTSYEFWWGFGDWSFVCLCSSGTSLLAFSIFLIKFSLFDLQRSENFVWCLIGVCFFQCWCLWWWCY